MKVKFLLIFDNICLIYFGRQMHTVMFDMKLVLRSASGVMAIAGWIAAAILAFMFAPQVQPLVQEIPVVGEYLSDSCELSIIASFAVVFALSLVVVSLFTPLFSSLVQRSALGGLDQGVGFLFGVLRGILLIAITFFVYETVITSQSIAMVDDSRSAQVFARMTQKIEDRDPEEALGWITSQYEDLVGVCGE